MISPFFQLPDSIKALCSHQVIIALIVASALSAFVVLTGFDWSYFLFVQSYNAWTYTIPALMGGMYIPLFGLPILYAIALALGKIKLQNTSVALMQSASFAWITSALLKALTGRIQPPHGSYDILIDLSRQWQFGFLNHGVFWGWPSSHTMVACAMAATLIALFPKKKSVVYTAILYGAYIGLSITFQIHWFSEFIAGAILGSTIGYIIGTVHARPIHEVREAH